MSREPEAAPPKRRMSAAKRRAVIVESATEVFAERGYDGAPIDEIARRSGISAPVLYDHFPSKLALFQEVLAAEYARLRAAWQVTFATAEPLRERFAASLDAWFAHVERRRRSIPVLFQVATADEGARQAQADATRASRSALAPFVTDVLTTDELDTEMLIEIIAASLRALALWWHDHPAVPRVRLVDAALDALWPAIERRVPPPS
ncbi:TetR family transcriptional regulator [Amycolatopsis sp. NBRC 101858]|uniref:TetR/AcrR family transcriptional regulator n=1 Tax=Amycolatopsis sp. NBRC 101858 TaxID=3032200 RepID=UPI0024A5835B|nr:TetR/AcrR family transcriptional regulator [Amycolatopsis sp. NBRC 101858]GLY38286.1 TetR family transcriptional regulator [Amycolatopsis sp. NBRC 101858]